MLHGLEYSTPFTVPYENKPSQAMVRKALTNPIPSICRLFMKHNVYIYIYMIANLGPARCAPFFKKTHCLISQWLVGAWNSWQFFSKETMKILITFQQHLPFSWSSRTPRTTRGSAQVSTQFTTTTQSWKTTSCCELPSSVVRNLAARPGHLGIFRTKKQPPKTDRWGTWKWGVFLEKELLIGNHLFSCGWLVHVWNKL